MRILAVLLLLASASASAQDAAIRFADADPRDLSFEAIVNELHVVTSWDDMEEREDGAVPVVLVSALVADDEILEMGRSRFVAMPVREFRRGATLRDSEVRLSREYREARAKSAMSGDLFRPANLVGHGETEIPGDMWFPGEMLFPGDMFLPGDMYFPGEMLDPEREEASVRLAGHAVGRFSAKEVDERELIRVARTVDPRAYESGEPFLIFFVARPDGRMAETEAIAILRKRPGR